MKTSAKQRKYIIEELQQWLDNARFRLRLAECAQIVMKDYIGKIATKREATKIHNEILKAYPETRMYFEVEKWGRTINFYHYRGADKLTQETVSIESLTTEKIYTQYIHNQLIESLVYRNDHIKNYEAQLENINELIDLKDKQETELKELQARQSLERETFAKQTKCSETSIDTLMETSEKRITREDQDEYYRKESEAFEKRISS